ncbi:MAG TPA: sigma-70 family RNA polymerase sigma factor [Acidobacteriaceae bacterium]|nr:sigma-70 family RNA polymerase sigma factor [Acidobacteriaceae bacterium]
MSESNLVCLAKAGDSRAFASLLERNRPRLFRKIESMVRQKEDAQDALQECFLKAWLHLDRFEGKAEFSTWLTRIAINEALMLIRKRRPMETFADSEIEISDFRLCPQRHYFGSEARAFVWHEVARLPQELRMVFTMRYMQELSTTEVACMLDLTTTTVKSRLYRVRQHLRDRRMNRRMNADFHSSVP